MSSTKHPILRSAFQLIVALGALAAFSSGQDEPKALTKAHKEAKATYNESLASAQLPIQKKYLKTLRAARKEAEKKDLPKLVSQLSREISALEKAIGAATEDEDKPIPPPNQSPAPPIVVDFEKAQLTGNVTRTTADHFLQGWTETRDKAVVPILLDRKQAYSIEMVYTAGDRGRLKVEIGSTKFLPDLEDTTKKGKEITLAIGEYLPKKRREMVVLSLPIHRSKPFVQVRSIRFLPQTQE